MDQDPLKVVYLCSDSPKDRAFLATLTKFLIGHSRAKRIVEWHTGMLEAGVDRNLHTTQRLNDADILILLISIDFLNSPSAYDIELAIAMQKHKEDGARVIPVLLRECDISDAPFSKLKMLPEDLVPVDQRDNKDAVFTGIAKAIGKVIQDLLNTRPRSMTQKRTFPKQLLHLCDRQPQHDRLVLALDKEEPYQGYQENEWSHRPLVLIIHGTSDECLEEFKDRLGNEMLPEILGAELSLEEYPLLLPDIGETFPLILRKNLARSFGNSLRSPNDLATLISQNPARVLVYSRLYGDRWQRQGFPKTDDFLSFWNEFPDLAPGHRLISCLLIIHQAEETANRRDATRFLRNLAQSVRLTSYQNRHGQTLDRLNAVVLPELKSVPLQPATDWIYGRHFRKLCATHEPVFCDRENSKQKIEEIYQRSPSIPMRKLIPQLEEIVSTRICKGY